jgi:hypothetical protein
MSIIRSFERVMRCRFGVSASVAAALAVAAAVSCHGADKGPATQSGSETASNNQAPPPEFDIKMPETTEPSDAGAAQPAASASAAEPERAPRRPQPKFSQESVIETIVGEPGAVMALASGAVLHIPDGALRDGKTLRFALVKTPAKGGPAKLGEAYELSPLLASSGPAFELTLPLPGGASNVELAVFVPADPKAKPPTKPSYKTLAPKTVDSAKKQVFFELAELPGGDVYLTAKK